MEYNRKLGWFLMLLGMVIGFLTTRLAPESPTTIETIIGLSVVWLVIVPLLIIGSTLAGGSPRFIERKLDNVITGIQNTKKG